jgi:hypothetical protein
LLLALSSAVIVRSESRWHRFYCFRFETPPTWRARFPYVPQEQGGPVIPQALGSLLIASYEPQGYGVGLRTRLHTGLTLTFNWLCTLLNTTQQGPCRNTLLPLLHLSCCIIMNFLPNNGNVFTEPVHLNCCIIMNFLPNKGNVFIEPLLRDGSGMSSHLAATAQQWLHRPHYEHYSLLGSNAV